MHSLLINKMALSALSALTFIGVFALSAPNVHADVASYSDCDNHIQISYSDNNQNKFYRVNGKTFYWDDLSPTQQARIKIVEDKLKYVEKSFQVQEKELSKYAAQLDEKAQAIEDEVSKLERVSVKFDKETINMNELQRVARELEKLANINEQLLRKKEAEMQVIESKLHAVDLSLVNDIERHAGALEELLIEIASEI